MRLGIALIFLDIYIYISTKVSSQFPYYLMDEWKSKLANTRYCYGSNLKFSMAPYSREFTINSVLHPDTSSTLAIVPYLNYEIGQQ